MSTTLDIENFPALLTYLRDTARIARDELPVFHNLAGGVSNRTVLVERASGESWVLKQALAKLRVKIDWFSDPARVHREALGLAWLEKLAPQGTITPLIFEDESQHLLAMQAVPRPHENWKTMLLEGRIEADHVEQFAGLLSAIHKRSAEMSDPLARIFDDRSFFESLRIEPYYSYTAQQVLPAQDFIHRLIADTRSRRLTIVHGDYSPKNILVHQGRLILLDHEVIHWGDLAFDLGFAMTHLLSKVHHLPDFRAKFAEAAASFWKTYLTNVGATPASRSMRSIESTAAAPHRDAGVAPTARWMDNAALESFAVRHTLACLLARAAGRSPLEYLSDVERRRQVDAVTSLMRSAPTSVPDLIQAFVREMEIRSDARH